jgi:lipopolysaccharide export LptBFGC system permease protein LptF
MWIIVLYVTCYVFGVFIFCLLAVSAISNRYEEEINEIDKTYNEILNEEIEKMRLKVKKDKPIRYDINKHLDYEYPNHNYHLLV